MITCTAHALFLFYSMDPQALPSNEELLLLSTQWPPEYIQWRAAVFTCAIQMLAQRRQRILQWIKEGGTLDMNHPSMVPALDRLSQWARPFAAFDDDGDAIMSDSDAEDEEEDPPPRVVGGKRLPRHIPTFPSDDEGEEEDKMELEVVVPSSLKRQRPADDFPEGERATKRARELVAQAPPALRSAMSDLQLLNEENDSPNAIGILSEDLKMLLINELIKMATFDISGWFMLRMLYSTSEMWRRRVGREVSQRGGGQLIVNHTQLEDMETDILRGMLYEGEKYAMKKHLLTLAYVDICLSRATTPPADVAGWLVSPDTTASTATAQQAYYIMGKNGVDWPTTERRLVDIGFGQWATWRRAAYNVGRGKVVSETTRLLLTSSICVRNQWQVIQTSGYQWNPLRNPGFCSYDVALVLGKLVDVRLPTERPQHWLWFDTILVVPPPFRHTFTQWMTTTSLATKIGAIYTFLAIGNPKPPANVLDLLEPRPDGKGYRFPPNETLFGNADITVNMWGLLCTYLAYGMVEGLSGVVSDMRPFLIIPDDINARARTSSLVFTQLMGSMNLRTPLEKRAIAKVLQPIFGPAWPKAIELKAFRLAQLFSQEASCIQ
jgi:hypothetical protein